MTRLHRLFRLLFDWRILILILPLFIFAEYKICTFTFHNKLVLFEAIAHPYYYSQNELIDFTNDVMDESEFFSEAWHPVHLAEVLELRGLDAQAEELLTRTVELHPENHLLRYHQGLMLLHMEQDSPTSYADTKMILQELLAGAEDAAQATADEVILPRGAAAIVTDVLSSKRVAILTHKESPYPARAELLHLLGWIAFEEQDHELSIHYLNRTILLGSHGVDTLNLLAWNWIRVGKADKAVELILHDNDGLPSSLVLKKTHIYALYADERYGEASKLFEDLVTEHPREEIYIETLVGILTEKEAYSEAADLIEKRLTVHPKTYHLRHLLAQVYHWAERHKESAAIYRELIEESEENAKKQ